MQNNRIPSIEECYGIMRDRMPQHIIEHSEQVMRVAVRIADYLNTTANINKEILIAASLLHDITKNESLTTHEHHDITGGKLIREFGFDRVAAIIEEHVELKDYSLKTGLREQEIVFYSDKRVMHTKIVSVDERISDLLIRYGKTEKIRQIILANKESILEIEKKINSYMVRDLHEVILDLTDETQKAC
jgi:uncharacterized protein